MTQPDPAVSEHVITVHRSELIPGGRGARIGYSDDHPDKVFLVIPAERPDYELPRCPCGCVLRWVEDCHRWGCPHCDDLDECRQQTVEKEPE